jgi:putative MATE family efflux protein
MATAVPAAPVAIAPRTRRILSGPIVPTLLALAAPNVAVLVLQVSVTVAEAYFVGWLGPDALAGVALVFPLVMLMQTMSAGGMGGGVASAVARALGGNRRDDANRLVLHAGIIAVTMGVAFTLGAYTLGPVLYRVMGGEGAALDAAARYSRAVFGGAVAFWLFNVLAAVVRGTGNMVVPAAAVVAVGALSIALAPGLMFGWGPFPRLGVAGAGIAAVSSYALGSCALATFLGSGSSLVRPSLAGFRPEWRLFAQILRVGAPAALNTVQTNLTVAVLTGLVGGFGTYAVAGYGLGARLEYLQIPIVFGFGAALVTMVGTNVGAGQVARARRVAWVGAGLAMLVTETIGLAAALFPHAWLGLFTSDPAVVAAGAPYLRIVGPFYGFFGLGFALYFASQGAGRLLWPLLAGFLRLSLAAAGGALALAAGGGLVALFGMMATAMVVFGTTVAIAIRGGAWGDVPRA